MCECIHWHYNAKYTLVERLRFHKLLPCTKHCSVPLSPCLLNKKFHHLHNTHHKTLTQGWWLSLYEAGHVSESYISYCTIVSHHRILAGGRKSELMQPATHYPVITTAKGEKKRYLHIQVDPLHYCQWCGRNCSCSVHAVTLLLSLEQNLFLCCFT